MSCSASRLLACWPGRRWRALCSTRADQASVSCMVLYRRVVGVAVLFLPQGLQRLQLGSVSWSACKGLEEAGFMLPDVSRPVTFAWSHTNAKGDRRMCSGVFTAQSCSSAMLSVSPAACRRFACFFVAQPFTVWSSRTQALAPSLASTWGCWCFPVLQGATSCCTDPSSSCARFYGRHASPTGLAFARSMSLILQHGLKIVCDTMSCSIVSIQGIQGIARW